MLWDGLLFVRLRNYENEKYFLGKNLVTKLGPLHFVCGLLIIYG